MGRPTAWHSVYRPTYHRPAHADKGRIRLRISIPLRCSTLSPLHSLQRQYVLNCEVSRYCILALHGSCKRTPIDHVQWGYAYHVVAESQSADIIVNRTITRHWPSIETTRINVTCLLVYRAYILKCPGMWQPRYCVCWLVREIYLVLWYAWDVGQPILECSLIQL